MVTPVNPDNYSYMYSLDASYANGGFSFTIGANSTPVASGLDISEGSDTEAGAGDKVSVTGGPSGNYDFEGTVQFTDSNSDTGTGYVLYDATTQQFYMVSNAQVSAAQQSNLALQPGNDMPICFMQSTGISTPSGLVKVEDLKVGDLVLTSDGRSVPVQWVGRQTVSKLFADELSLPVRIKAGAIAENVPARDLLVSHDHALFIDGALIHAGALINGTSITRERNVPNKFVYYHVEVADHSLILAE